MKDMDYLKDRFKRIESRLDLLEGFLKWMFNLEHRRPIDKQTKPRKE